MSLRPLRGRVVIRPLVPKRIGSIILPDMSQDWQRNAEHAQGVRAQSSHFGTVVAIGEPARIGKRQVEVEPGFSVGDKVAFVWNHNELEYTKEIDGETACFVAQEHVLAVIE